MFFYFDTAYIIIVKLNSEKKDITVQKGSFRAYALNFCSYSSSQGAHLPSAMHLSMAAGSWKSEANVKHLKYSLRNVKTQIYVIFVS